MLKIAAIDVGSNALRLIVGELDDAWNVTSTTNMRVPVRLGQDVFTRGQLEESTMQQVEEAFRRFKHVIADAGVYRLRAVATSAMREASNGPELVERIQACCGIQLEIIDAVEEACLVHLAVSRALDLQDRRTLLVDIGGGSVEVALVEAGAITAIESYRLGAVRLLKMMEQADLSPQETNHRLADQASQAGAGVKKLLAGQAVEVCAGTGGNVVELGHLRRLLFAADTDRLVTREDLHRIIDRLSPLNADEIARRFDLRPDRADVVVAAAFVLQSIAENAGVQQVLIPNVGLKEGLLVDIAISLSRRPLLDRRASLIESAMRMGRKYQFDEQHAVLIQQLARQVFQQTEPLHSLGEKEELLLEVAALLHDIGHFINTIDHDRHGYYLLKANHLVGLDPREEEMVAVLVRCHRGKTPPKDLKGFQALPAQDRQIVLKLSALLNLADSLDESHSSQVHQVSLQHAGKEWQLDLPPDLQVEKYTLERRKALFQKVFRVKLEVT